MDQTLHLKQVYGKLIGISHKWYDLGLQLDFNSDALDNIQSSASDPKGQLRELLNKWLKKVEPTPPTWRIIIKALRNDMVGEERLAQELEQKYCKGDQSASSSKERASDLKSPQPPKPSTSNTTLKASQNISRPTTATKTPLPPAVGQSSTLKDPPVLKTTPKKPAKRDAEQSSVDNTTEAHQPKRPKVSPNEDEKGKTQKATIIGKYRFVQHPPDILLCVLCKRIAEEPYQLKCSCGKLCCKTCFDNRSEFRCPGCLQYLRSTPEGFPDKRSEKEIQDLHVECNNQKKGCTWTGKLSELESHREECPKEKIACPYSGSGCSDQFLREKLEEHLTQKQKQHAYFAGNTIKTLKHSVTQLEGQIIAATRTPPLVLKISNIPVQDDEYHIRGPVFYTSKLGYKMHLGVESGYRAFSSRDPFTISLFVQMVHGVNDKDLQWPCGGEIKINILNQTSDTNHIATSIPFTSYNLRPYRPVSQLHQYIVDGCLYIQVSEVKFDENIKPWLLSPGPTKSKSTTPANTTTWNSNLSDYAYFN